MQIYFVKATYENNVYKIGDFFLNDAYKLNANKMLDINWKPDDGISEFITKNITLTDTTKIWDHTHIIVPDYDKIFRISSIDYLNVQQYRVIVDEDPLIGNYQALRSKVLILNRTNRPEYFRGLNDIANQSIKESVETDSISSEYTTGKWALLFFQYDQSDKIIGLRFETAYKGKIYAEDTYANITTDYPEVTTTDPELYDYYQKIVYNTDGPGGYMQCVHINGDLKWVYISTVSNNVYYFNINATNAFPAKINETDVMTVCVVLPFDESVRWNNAGVNGNLLSYTNFLGPVDTSLIDIKIVSDNFMKISGSVEAYATGGSGATGSKRLSFSARDVIPVQCYLDATASTTPSTEYIYNVFNFYDDIDISASYIATTPSPKEAEPFNQYDLYIYGKKFKIPYYLSDKIRLLMAINSGVVNYTIYYNNDKRNILGSGSFTHSIKYQIDQLDAFYSQNPTYKEQYFTKMSVDAIKTIAGGAIAGSAVPGIGTGLGLATGIAGAGVDYALARINLDFQERGLLLKPDQMFGENSEVTLQVINIFGIYWVKRTPENADLMTTEYDLRGFPTSRVTTIDTLDYEVSTLFNSSKIIYGETKEVIKNLYVTGYINQKLDEGIILIP